MLFVNREGVMEIGDGSRVPRVTGHGARQKAVFVVDEVGDDHSHKLLWELGNWGRRRDGYLGGTSTEQPFDLGFCSVPKSVNEGFTRCRRINTMRLLNGMQNHLSTRK